MSNMNNDNEPIDLPQTPVYDASEIKPSEAFDHGGGIDNRLEYIQQEIQEVIKPLNAHYSQVSKPGALADVRLLKRLDNFFIWFDEIPLKPGLEPALRSAFEVMQGPKWPTFRSDLAADCIHNSEHWGWDKPDDQSNQWPKHINEEWDVEEDEEPPEDPEPEVREATPERKVPFYNIVVHPEQYGHNGLVPGQMFSDQKAAVEHGAHADLTFSGVGAGCRKGAGQNGVYSVIVADKYGSINEDCGDVILYAGTGALKSTSTAEMHKANKWLNALRRSAGKPHSPPVRVLRKYSADNPYAHTREPQSSLRYDGLYKVVKMQQLQQKAANGIRNGPMYEEFRLERVEPDQNAPSDSDKKLQGTLEEAKKRGEKSGFLVASPGTSLA